MTFSLRTCVPYLSALVAGCALPFSFAPYGMWPLAFFSLGVLFWITCNTAPRRAARLGFIFGLGYFSLGVHWIYYSLHLFGAAVAPLSAFLTLVFILVMTLFPLMTCWAFAWIGRESDRSVSSVFLFAACWTISELLRSWVFGGFPWLLVGYSQINSVFSGYAPVVGVYGIGWIMLVIAGSLAIIIGRAQRRRRTAAALLLVFLSGAAAALSPIEWTTAKDSTFNVRLVQGNIPQEMKFSRERLDNSLRTYVDMSRTAPDGTNIVIWPETAIPTYFHRVDEALTPFADEMSSRGIDVLSGGFHKDESERVYNSFRQLGGDRALYSKRHLVPFGEFMPFRFLLDFVSRFIVIPMSDLSVPEGPVQPLSIQGEQLGISICYEDVFGEEMRAVLPASTVLINISNDAWFGDAPAPQQHQEMAQMRAREFARPLIRVTNTGISSSISHRGDITHTIAHSTQGVLDVEVVPRVGETPYVTVGSWPVKIAAVLTVILALGLRRRAQRLSQSG